MRKAWAFIAFGVVPAAVVGGAVLLIGIGNRPRFVARAALEVDWKTMPSVPSDDAATKVRNKWRDEIISEFVALPHSEKAIREFLGRCGAFNGNQTQMASAISKLRKGLRTSATHGADNCDRFTIELNDNDAQRAKTMADLLLQDEVSNLRSQGKAGSGLAALRSYSNVENIIQRKAELGRQLAELENNYSHPFDPEIEHRYEVIQEELNDLEGKHFEEGLGLLGNLGGMLFDDSVKVVEAAHVEKRRAIDRWLIVMMAAALGGVAGFTGLAVRRSMAASSNAS